MKKDDLSEDYKGYLRFKNTEKLVHRWVAHKYIYLKNRKKYILPFNEYQVHHKDGNKKNNKVENLELKTIYEHEHEHKVERAEWQIIRALVVVIFMILLIGIIGLFVKDASLSDNVRLLILLAIFIISAITIKFVNREKKGHRYI